jgi:hypothetical protein
LVVLSEPLVVRIELLVVHRELLTQEKGSGLVPAKATCGAIALGCAGELRSVWLSLHQSSPPSTARSAALSNTMPLKLIPHSLTWTSAYHWNAVMLPHTQPCFVVCPTNTVSTGTFPHFATTVTASHFSASISILISLSARRSYRSSANYQQSERTTSCSERTTSSSLRCSSRELQDELHSVDSRHLNRKFSDLLFFG